MLCKNLNKGKLGIYLTPYNIAKYMSKNNIIKI